MLLMVILPHRAAPLTARVVAGVHPMMAPEYSGWTKFWMAASGLVAAVHMRSAERKYASSMGKSL
jgi:hypothetical protein